MQILKYSNLSNKRKYQTLEYILVKSNNLGWNTTVLLKRTEALKDKNYGAYIIENNNKINGFYIISDSDGTNKDSTNFSKYQPEEKAYWVCSLFIDKTDVNIFIKVLNSVKSQDLLKIAPLYIYFENQKLYNIMCNRYNVRRVTKEYEIYKISHKQKNIPYIL